MDTPWPICGLAVDSFEALDFAYRVKCQRCGTFQISRSLQAQLSASITARERSGLMAAIREASGRNDEVVLTPDSWRQLSAPFATLSIAQKIRRLLEHVGDCSQTAGASVVINDELEYPRFAAVSKEEYHWLRRTLLSQRLVEQAGSGLALTLEGWEAYRPWRSGSPGTCFVAMAFHPEMEDAFLAGIRPAVEQDCGFTVVRVDKVQHNDNINERIIGEIRSAQFLIADFTHHRNGVYFEAGFAMGLGRPVIWTCRSDELPKAHFDTRPYNHVVWETAVQLRERLAARILATVPK